MSLLIVHYFLLHAIATWNNNNKKIEFRVYYSCDKFYNGVKIEALIEIGFGLI